MKHVVHFFRKQNKGYISIEGVIIAGLIVGLGATSVSLFHENSSVQVETANNTVTGKLHEGMWMN